MKIRKYYLSFSEHTRRNEKIIEVENIILCYIDTDKSALGIRNVIEGGKRNDENYFSVNYVVGEEILCIIPENESSIVSLNDSLNTRSIGIGICNNRYDKLLLNSLVNNLILKYNLSKDAIKNTKKKYPWY